MLLLAAAVGAGGLGGAPPLRIMPFGDSITVFDCRDNAFTAPDDRPVFQPLPTVAGNPTGAAFPYPDGTYFVVGKGGYRGFLGQELDAPGSVPPAWSYVGSNFLCGSHEGYSGQTVAWLANRTTAIVAAAQPDIVLFMAGTNDFFYPEPRGARDPAVVEARLRVLLDRAFAAAPRTTFLVSTVTHINASRCEYYHTAPWHPYDCPADMQPNIEAYNRLLPGVVRDYRAAGRSIYLHDVNAEAGWVAEDYWIWGIHFNSTGFAKMAQSWATAIRKTPAWRTAARDAGRAGGAEL